MVLLIYIYIFIIIITKSTFSRIRSLPISFGYDLAWRHNSDVTWNDVIIFRVCLKWLIKGPLKVAPHLSVFMRIMYEQTMGFPTTHPSTSK